MEFLVENKVVLLAFLLALSEVLALVPLVKSNSVFQLVVNSLKGLHKLFVKPEPPKA